MANVVIQNEELSVRINTLGAEITSIQDRNGTEYIWDGNPDIWEGHAPILFPIVSGLEDGKYRFCGQEYYLEKHGFAMNSEFEVEEQSLDGVTFLLTSSEQTRVVYPFDFEFRVRYTLCGRNLSVDFITANKTQGNMYYSAGAHEAYCIEGDITNYSIVLEKDEILPRYEVLPSGIINPTPVPCFNSTRDLKLSEEYFTIDAIIFFDMQSRSLSLRDDRTGKAIHIDFPGFDTLLIWRKPGAAYVCIEPWAGAPDLPWHPAEDFSSKYRIRTLKEGESEILTHRLRF
ncbi:MAG: aldose 1-epimerase family protein [Ruminococcaceae bacterium]|nr:aldose 1-epimerase family protein [Oscillospiraceae bacterium]